MRETCALPVMQLNLNFERSLKPSSAAKTRSSQDVHYTLHCLNPHGRIASDDKLRVCSSFASLVVKIDCSNFGSGTMGLVVICTRRCRIQASPSYCNGSRTSRNCISFGQHPLSKITNFRVLSQPCVPYEWSCTAVAQPTNPALSPGPVKELACKQQPQK